MSSTRDTQSPVNHMAAKTASSSTKKGGGSPFKHRQRYTNASVKKMDNKTTSRSTKNLSKKEGSPLNDRHLRRKIKGHQAFSRDHDDHNEDDEIMPGAVAVGTTRIAYDDSMFPPSTVGQMMMDGIAADPMWLEEGQIVAHLATNDETRIAHMVEERLRKQKENEVIVAAEEVKYSSSNFCGLQKRTTRWVLALLTLLSIGGVVTGVVSSRKGNHHRTPSPASPALPPLEDPLLEELRSVNAFDDDDLALFDDPTSPQSQSLTWLKDDAIVMSSGRSTKDLLQRYVLAVLYFATSGSSWTLSSMPSNEDVCTWNNGTEHRHGVYCQLDGVPMLNELILDNNNLQGSLPWELVLLTDLEIINLSGNQLSGFIPTSIGKLTLLRTIDFSSNVLRGPLPTKFSSATVAIDLSSNELMGTIPQAWGTNMPKLQYIDLQVNDLTGPLPTTLGQLTSLSVLGLTSNLFSRMIPSELGQLRSLVYFLIAFNKLTGTIPSELGHLLSLNTLRINDNQLTGTIPSELSQMLSLETLQVFSNQLVGTIPSELGQLLSLQSLWIGNNQLTGTIASELLHLLSLESLVMDRNRLTGTIPSELGQLLSLADLRIYANQLTGTIPFELSQLRSLETLWISNNTQLTGTIPSEFGQLLSLSKLDISDNMLNGTIPSELGKLLSLSELYIHSNPLTGTIPSELFGISSLAHFDVSRSLLTGSDQLWCSDNRTWNFLGADCDEVDCTCCTYCCSLEGDPPTSSCNHMLHN